LRRLDEQTGRLTLRFARFESTKILIDICIAYLGAESLRRD
jgi:hypothetical protein